jgi:hypothetical protein
LPNIVHYRSAQGTFGAGSTVTNQYGFLVESSLIGATNNYAFAGLLASGTNRWNLYMAGTASNYLAGKLLIGSTTDSGELLQINGTSKFTGALSGTSATFSGLITTSASQAINFTNIGSDTYTRTSIYNNTTDGFLIDLARTTNASDGTPISFSIAPRGGSPFMRITSGGLINLGTSGGSGRLNVLANPANNILVEWQNSVGVTVGTVTVVGAGTQTAYNTSSDYRLKEDLQEIKGLEKLSKVKVYDFKWKGFDERMDGVLAHELADVLPYAVSGEKDGEQMQGVDYSKIVPILVKAIQEQQAQIEELKAELDQLKNK